RGMVAAHPHRRPRPLVRWGAWLTLVVRGRRERGSRGGRGISREFRGRMLPDGAKAGVRRPVRGAGVSIGCPGSWGRLAAAHFGTALAAKAFDDLALRLRDILVGEGVVGRLVA